MRVLATCPGRFGDALWAMPSVRAIAEGIGAPVDLALSAKYGSIAPLLEAQPYIGKVLVLSVEDWPILETAPMTPRIPPFIPEVSAGVLQTGEFKHWDTLVHLGYSGWPTEPLPQYVYSTVRTEHPELPLAPLDLERPWIAGGEYLSKRVIGVGFSDEWFELKLGVVTALEFRQLITPFTDVCCPTGSRWQVEFELCGRNWDVAGKLLASRVVFFGCCSALHVLAVALGKPCVIMEPNPQRHHPIFWPLGTTGRVKLVLGNDGLPTFDARHCREYLQEALK